MSKPAIESIESIDEHTKSEFAIKLALFDIDGTLLDKAGHYGPELAGQITRIRAAGVKTAIASGRPHFAAQFIVDELGISDPGVFCTGAHFYDPLRQQTLAAHFISEPVGLRLLETLRDSPLYYELYTEDAFYYETDYAADVRRAHSQHLRAQVQRADLSQLCQNAKLMKFLLGGQGEQGHKILKALETQFEGELVFAYARFPAYPDWFFASVISAVACKQQAFAKLLAYYDVKAENVVSFGDSQSDMVFLQAAGHGVAMANAAPEVQAVARWLAPEACDDGVAQALKRLI